MTATKVKTAAVTNAAVPTATTTAAAKKVPAARAGEFDGGRRELRKR